MDLNGCATPCDHCDREYCRFPCLDIHMRRCPQNPYRRSDDADSETDDATSQSKDENPCDRCGDPMA
eukprot:12410386-Karenia_brevis.AAC.1